jgi:dUTP pyrophosphatase
MIPIKIKKIVEHAILPEYKSSGAAGFDFYSANKENVCLQPKETKLIGTGISVEIPEGYEIQVRSRSGLALKDQIVVLNSPGTIDSDYRGEIGVILINHGHEPFIITPSMRIAQGILAPVETALFLERDTLSETDRNDGGFGSTKV